MKEAARSGDREKDYRTLSRANLAGIRNRERTTFIFLFRSDCQRRHSACHRYTVACRVFFIAYGNEHDERTHQYFDDEDNDDFGKLVELYLSQHPDYVFNLVWKKTGETGERV